MNDKLLNSIFIKLTLCLVLTCIPLLVFAKATVQQPVRLEAANALQMLKSKSETPIRTRWHVNRGTVRSLYNLTIPAQAGTSEASARQFLNNYRNLFAMNDSNIELRLKRVQHSLTGEHVRLHQYYKGVEVYSAEMSVHTNRFGQIRVVHSNYFPQISVNTAPSISPGEAINAAVTDANARILRKPPRADLVIFPNREALKIGDYANAYRLAYRAIIHSWKPLAGWEYIIDANTGQRLHRRNLIKFADGRGRVFNPNPVVALKDRTLTDQDDSAEAIQEEAYTDVILPELDGTGFLDGTYVSTKLTKYRAKEPTLTFNYTRDDDRFEEVMVYYHIDAVARYLKKLGFNLVDDWPIPVNAHFDDEDNSFYDGESLNFGDGGVDDAEDAEVIIHEYGHAILDQQVKNIYRDEGGAIHEGFSDFLAAGFYSAVSEGFGDTTVFDWAGTFDESTRPLDSDKHYPDDIKGEVHADGEIWSAALWEIFEAIGRDESLRLVIESHFLLSPDTEFVDGASAILVTEQDLNGGENFDLVLGIMENRGFLTPPQLVADSLEDNDTVETAAAIELPFVDENLSIDTADNDDYYSFSLEETMQVGIGIDFIPIYGELILALTGPDGVEIVTFETDDIASVELEPGDYLITVSGINGATNDYALAAIIDEHGDSPDTATPVSIGDTIGSFIDFTGDTDFFAVKAREGQMFEITVKTADSDLDSLLVIYNPDGDLLDKNDDYLDSESPNPFQIDSRVVGEAPADGTYLIGVSNVAPPNINAPFGGVNYSYTLSIVENIDYHAECGSGETPLLFDEPVTGAINFADDLDGFRFKASAGDVIALIVEAESLGSWLNPVLKLFNEKGEELIFVDNAFDEEYLSLDPRVDGFLIPADGEYCVEISSYRGGGNDYTYTLTLSEGVLPKDDHDNLRGTPTPIVVNTPVDGTISFAGDLDAFQFTAQAGNLITFHLVLNKETFSTSLKVYDSNRKFLTSATRWSIDWKNGNLEPLLEEFEIPADGIYYIQIGNLFGVGHEDFTYTLTLTKEFPAWDVNQDGKVDIFDLVLVGKHFGEDVTAAAPTNLFGQPRSTSTEGELRLRLTPSATDTRQLTVSIDTTPIADLYGYHFSIQYDPAVLELLSASPSQVLAGVLPQNYWNLSQQGTQLNLMHVRQGAPKGVDAEGSLVKLVFNVKLSEAKSLVAERTQRLTSQLPINLVGVQLADSLTQAIPIDIIDEPISLANLFPTEPMLLQNYPNPFNPETWIPYQIPADSEVTISIYDTKGRLIRQLYLGHQHVGTYITRDKAAYWDGRNLHGERAANGVYFYQLQSGKNSATRKMTIIR